MGVGLSRIDADGGEPEVVTTLDEAGGELSHRWPQVVPGGKGVLFTVMRGTGVNTRANDRIAVHSFETGETRYLVESSYARVTPTGHLVYARPPSQTLYAVGFDLARLEIVGSGVPVQVGVRRAQLMGIGHGNFAVSETGTLAYLRAAGNRRLVLVDRDGNRTPLDAPTRAYARPRFSPDGRRVAVATSDGQLFVYDLETDRLGAIPIPFEPLDRTVLWSADGQHAVVEDDGRNLVLVSLAASAAPEVIVESPEGRELISPHAWIPKGGGVLYALRAAGGSRNWDIWEKPPEGDPAPVVKGPYNENQPALSPDGRWLTYKSNATGRDEIWLRAYAGSGAGQQISTDGGSEPLWSRDGAEVYYRHGDEMMAVPITSEPSLSAGRPRPLFVGDYDMADGWNSHNYDLSPDGEHFVMVEPIEKDATARLHVVVNWFTELERLVPTK